jgi:uncharacterized protein
VPVQFGAIESDLLTLGVLLGGTVSGATGVAFPVIAGPLLLLEYQPAQAVLLTAICSLAGQFFSMALLRRSIDYRVRWPLVLPGLFCIPMGTSLLLLASPTAIKIGFGALLALSSFCVLVHRPLFALRSKLIDMIVGACGGVCAGAFGASSVIPAFWFSLQGLDRHGQRGILQPYIIVMQIASFALLLKSGIYNGIALQDVAVWVGAALAGVAVGSFIFYHISCALYSRAIVLITFGSSLLLIIHH